jgi:hypothetical protein
LCAGFACEQNAGRCATNLWNYPSQAVM